MKIFDCFLFFNELDMLELRMEILNDYVDYFVVTESSVTFSGKKKELILEKNFSRFDKFKHKMIYNVVENTPMDTDAWGREIFQRNAMVRQLGGCDDFDIVITGDLDEAPNLEKMQEWYRSYELFHMNQKFYYYWLNGFKRNNWYGTKVCNYGMLKKYTPDELRNVKHFGYEVLNGGWHWSYLGSPDQIKEKLGAFSHTEFDNDYYKNSIEDNMKKNKDLFFRNNESIQIVPIDDSYPPYIKNNQNKLSKYIKEI